MKKIIFFIFAIISFASEYYGKVEPFEVYKISAKTAGYVVFVDSSLEGNLANKKEIIRLDDSLVLIEEKIQKENLQILKEIYLMREDKYERIKDLSTKTIGEKESEKIAFLSSKSAYLGSKLSYENTKKRLADMRVFVDGVFINKIYVKEGSFVNVGTPLFDSFDESKSKITIFISKEDYINISSKEIVVDGKKDLYKIDKLWNVGDDKYLSSYKLELIGPKVDLFSKLVKVEIR